MKLKTRVCVLTLVLAVVVAGLYCLSGVLYSRAFSRIGEYGRDIDEWWGTDVTEVLGVWYPGYTQVGEAYIYVGVAFGSMLGIMICFLLWLAGLILPFFRKAKFFTATYVDARLLAKVRPLFPEAKGFPNWQFLNHILKTVYEERKEEAET